MMNDGLGCTFVVGGSAVLRGATSNTLSICSTRVGPIGGCHLPTGRFSGTVGRLGEFFGWRGMGSRGTPSTFRIFVCPRCEENFVLLCFLPRSSLRPRHRSKIARFRVLEDECYGRVFRRRKLLRTNCVNDDARAVNFRCHHLNRANVCSVDSNVRRVRLVN